MYSIGGSIDPRASTEFSNDAGAGSLLGQLTGDLTITPPTLLTGSGVDVDPAAIDDGLNTIAVGDNGLTTGDAVVYTTGDENQVEIGGLDVGGTYYVHVDGGTISLHTSRQGALDDTGRVNIFAGSAVDAGEHRLDVTSGTGESAAGTVGGTADPTIGGAVDPNRTVPGAVTAALIADSPDTANRVTLIADSILVTADQRYDVDITAGNVSIGLLSLGAAVAIVSIGNVTIAEVGDFALLQAGNGTIVVEAKDRQTRDAFSLTEAISGQGGIVALGAAIALFDATIDVTAEVGTNAVLTVLANPTADPDVTVSATSLTDLRTTITGINGSGVSVTVTRADAHVLGTTKAVVGGDITADDVSITAHATRTADAELTSFAVTGVGVSTAEAYSEIGAHTEVLVTASASFDLDADLTVLAHSDNTARSDTLGGVVGGIAVNAQIPEALISGHTTVTFHGDVLAANDVTITSEAENTADATATLVSISVAGGGLVEVTADITDTADTATTVSSLASFSLTGSFTAQARTFGTGNTADALADRKAGGLLGDASVMIAEATVDGAVTATLDTSVVTTGGGIESIKVFAHGRDLATATTDVVSGGGLFAVSGAVTTATIGADADVVATVGAGATLTSNGGIVVQATADHDADAESDVASGGALAFGVTIPTATIGATTRAQLLGDVVAGDSLLVDADATYAVTAESTPIVVGLVAGAGAEADAEILTGASVEAHIGPAVGIGGIDRPVIDVGSGAVNVTADASMTASAVSDSIAGGAFTLSIMLPSATVAGVTRAFVRDGTAIEAGSLNVHAGTVGDRVVYSATATSENLAISFIGGSGAEATATVTGTVEAFVGAPSGAVPGGPPSAVIDIAGVVSVQAYSDIDATAVADAGSGGAVSISVMLPSADVAGTTRAYIGQGVRIEAASVDVDADGDYDAFATSWLMTIAAASANAAVVTATVSGVVDAHVGSAAGTAPSANLAQLDLTGSLTVDVHATMDATPQVNKALGIAIVDVTVLFPTARLVGTVRAYVGEGVDIDAASVSITASAPNLAAVATAEANGFSALLGIGIIDADATNNSTVEAFIGAHRSIDASNVTTRVEAGTITLTLDTALTATATADSNAFSGAVTLSVMAPTARVGGYAGSYVRDGVDLSATSLAVTAGTVGDRVVMSATARSDALGVSLLLSGSIIVAEAVVEGTVEAFVGAAAGRTAGGDPDAVIAVDTTVTVTAASDIDADAELDADTAGAVAVSVLIPTAWALGTTRAYAGDGAQVHATGVTITADGDVRADATTEAFTAGAGGVSVAGSEAVVASRTEAFLGQKTIRPGDAANPGGTRALEFRSADGIGRGAVTLAATTKSVAHARNEAFTVGGVGVNVLFPEAKLSGFTSAYIGPDTDVFAATITMTATDTVATAEAIADGVAGGAVTVSSLTSDAKVSRATEAFVDNGARVDIGGFSMSATASSPANLADATSKGGSGGLIGIGLFDAKAYIGDDTVFLPAADLSVYGAPRPTMTTRSVTRAFIGNGARIVDEDDITQTGANNVTLTATATSTTNADVGYFGINGIADVLVSTVRAETGHDAEVFIGDDAIVNISGQLKATATNSVIASPDISSTSVSAIDIDILSAEGEISSDTGAWIGNGAEITAGSIDFDARAGDPTNPGTIGHSATVLIDTGGFGVFLSIKLLDAKATDSGSVFVRLGPAGAGSSSNRTKLTTTGAGGIAADAFLRSTLRAEPNFEAFSLFGAGGGAQSFAEQKATVDADVGEWAELVAQQGGIHVDATFVGRTEANASGVAAAAVGVTGTDAEAVHDPTVTTAVAANASLSATGTGGAVEVLAHHNHSGTGALSGQGGIASASNRAFGLAAGIGSDIDVTASADVEVDVAGNSNFAAAGTVRIASFNANQALATVDSKAIAAITINAATSVTANAWGTTTTTFDGRVGTAGTPGAEDLEVLAFGYATADAAMKSVSGGAISVGGGSATANAAPDLTVNFGTSSTIAHVSDDLAVLGHQVSDADARAAGVSGGAITVSGFNSTITVTPDVTVNVEDTDTVIAGGTIAITAQHGGGPGSVSDGTVYAADGTGNFITLTASGENQPLAHQLSTGNTITYSGSCCGLGNGQRFNVIVRDANTIYLGNQFNAGSQVSTANDTITFGHEHNFAEGEQVFYFTNGGGTIGGLSDSTRYSVNVIDEFTIKLLPDGQSENSRNVSSVNGGTDVVTTTTDHGFSDGLNVTYHAPAPTVLFTNAMVDVASNGTAGPNIGTTFPLNSTNNNAIFAGQPNAGGTWSPHTFSNGDAVIYRSLDGSNIGLTSGVMYFVFVIDGFLIRLAPSYCDAVGSDASNGCLLPDDGDADYDPERAPGRQRPALALAGHQERVTSELRHTLTRASLAPIPGLTDGTTYLVDTSGLGANQFRLQTLGGAPIGIALVDHEDRRLQPGVRTSTSRRTCRSAPTASPTRASTSPRPAAAPPASSSTSAAPRPAATTASSRGSVVRPRSPGPIRATSSRWRRRQGRPAGRSTSATPRRTPAARSTPTSTSSPVPTCRRA